ncbi:tRNA lysidine(34) synthetase TilS [Acholeplasma hippikon]|uniref:tRNA(Ile)-lysidine synthase n=1 Tax=Acholeplasma hippikon TaxID=264636 RepID=A0A449BKU2_9MOLU|nr:tRNA lysidine(34) synthetase TilS [Acholeplasma hippikon]VEU83069.1 tRNA(Ile)-lysidine synthase [Acholeplasma hippikon]
MNLHFNLNKKNKYIVAVSGGVDSMVLLHALILAHYDIVVVHFNHQKRAESFLDHELVESVTSKYKIPYHYIKLSIKNGNFQEKARELRYKHLTEIADLYQTKDIITAHHSDDLIETVLMKIIRGSNLLGYSGIREKTNYNGYIYHKPLISYTKDEIYTFAYENNILFNEDISNKSDDYFRNRLRNNVLPILKEENDLASHFANFSKQTYLASDFIRSETKKFLNGSKSFNLDQFNNLHEAVKTDIISYLLEQANALRSFEKIYKIINQLSSKKPNIEIKVNKTHILIKQYNEVILKELSELQNNTLNVNLYISHKKTEAPNNSIELCYNKLDFPIKIRTRLPGDVLAFPFGHKKLKNFLIDKKVPKYLRDNLIIVVDQSETILWIPGLYINKTLGDSNQIYLSIKE